MDFHNEKHANIKFNRIQRCFLAIEAKRFAFVYHSVPSLPLICELLSRDSLRSLYHAAFSLIKYHTPMIDSPNSTILAFLGKTTRIYQFYFLFCLRYMKGASAKFFEYFYHTGPFTITRPLSGPPFLNQVFDLSLRNVPMNDMTN